MASSHHLSSQSYQSHAASHRPVPSYNPVAAINAPAGTFLPGTKVQVGSHRVVVEKYLSEGGFAHVYVVRLSQPVDGSDKAVLKRVAVPDKSALANMRTEVETMKKLKGHRHIVKYIDSHASQLKGGGYEVFLVMEYCSGGGLIDFMNTRLQNRLTEPEVIKIFSDVAEGVACMHYLKPPLLHRDLKVENVLISRHGSSVLYKLCDFGSAAPPRPAATSAAEGRLIEDDVQRHTTLQYRSPEMIDVYRKQPIDEKSDIWALGVLLYKLCYYTTPFEEVGQMAILNATYKFPSYPPFSSRLKMFISSMLRENPQKRPNVYQVLHEVCQMQGREVPIQDIYAQRSTSEARRYQELPPSPTETPQLGAVFSPPIQETQISIPEIAPMRRGRPTRPDASQHNSARPSPSPFRGASTDPFAALDGGQKSPVSGEEFSDRFPSLDQFNILHEKKGKFDFEPTVTDNKEDDALAQRLTNALADEAFVKRPSPPGEPASAPPTGRRSQPAPPKKSPIEFSQYRDEPSRSQAPLYQPAPKKPIMVSTGTMTSPPASPGLSELKPPNRPIYRFPSSEQQTKVTDSERRTSRQGISPTAGPKLDVDPRISSDRLSNLSASSRPSLEALRPSYLDPDDFSHRSRSANSRSRPVSVHAGTKLELPPRSAESARSSLDLPRSPYEDGAPLQHAWTEAGQYDRGNISSDVDYLRAKEEESNRKREKRYSGSSSKHTKRSSLSTLSLSGTKTLLASRFGDAFRRFEGNQDGKVQSPAQEEFPRFLSPVPGSESTGEAVGDSGDDDDDISPEMRRELERRRLSQEEKRVASAAAEYRRRVAEKGEGGRQGDKTTLSPAILNRVQTLLGEASRPPAPKTATGYGRFTENSDPALQAKQPDVQPTSSRPSTMSAAPPSAPLPKQETSSSAFAAAQRTGPRPTAPPKPRSLRPGTTGTDPPATSSFDRPQTTHATTPTTPGEDWEANFSRRFPSLSGLEMVETEIEIPKFPAVRTKEV
ncbi:putative serine/threonine protein kinase [Aspergillus lucknowensis]|uniref:non-specific serine/threonine protein kinase n=1 Tax=Aspergillus lucknowensis TaxID=176173 RepID=A0ABR4LQ82_9EURO